MPRVHLVHWNAVEAEERAGRLQAAGYQVDYETLDGASALRALAEDPPAAVVIDLGRLPSHGRSVGMALRQRKGTRHLPLVFIDGDAEKVAAIKRILPDAVYTTWSRVRSSLKRAIAYPPAEPMVPPSNMDGYSGTPLPKKLGIKADSSVALVGAPLDFAALAHTSGTRLTYDQWTADWRPTPGAPPANGPALRLQRLWPLCFVLAALAYLAEVLWRRSRPTARP